MSTLSSLAEAALPLRPAAAPKESGGSSKSRYNGCIGSLLRFDAASQRWAVRLLPHGDRILVRPECLEAVPDVQEAHALI